MAAKGLKGLTQAQYDAVVEFGREHTFGETKEKFASSLNKGAVYSILCSANIGRRGDEQYERYRELVHKQGIKLPRARRAS